MFVLKAKDMGGNSFYYTNIADRNGQWVFSEDKNKGYKYETEEQATEAQQYLNLATGYFEIEQLEEVESIE